MKIIKPIKTRSVCIIEELKAGRTYRERPQPYTCKACGQVAFAQKVSSVKNDERPFKFTKEQEELFVKTPDCIICAKI